MQFAEWVYEGTIGTELLRPVDFVLYIICTAQWRVCIFYFMEGNSGFFHSFFILRGVGPAGAGEFLLFLISVLLALVILFYVEFMVGLASFYTLSMFGMAFTKTAVLSILSGGVVPLALFPEGVARVFGLLPFAGMVSVPLNIFLGKYGLEECMGYMGLQIFWCIVMGALAHLLYHMVIRKVIVQGG